MDLTCYADLAVRLVNTAADAGEADWLRTTSTLQAFAAGCGLAGPAAPATHHDLDALRVLRAELTSVFLAAARRDYPAAAAGLNALLVRYPVRPVLVRHGRSGWHLHLDDSGSVSDRCGAGAVTGVAAVVSQFGISHLGVCTMPGCASVFAAPVPGSPVRYCPGHCGGKQNVTALRNRQPADGLRASSAAG